MSPVIAQVKKAVVQVSPPGLEVTVYEVAPTDATQATFAKPSAATAVTPVGAKGIDAAAIGVAVLLEAEGAEVPEVFVAVTANEYAVPFASGETEQGEITVMQTTPPGLDVTV